MSCDKIFDKTSLIVTLQCSLSISSGETETLLTYFIRLYVCAQTDKRQWFYVIFFCLFQESLKMKWKKITPCKLQEPSSFQRSKDYIYIECNTNSITDVKERRKLVQQQHVLSFLLFQHFTS